MAFRVETSAEAEREAEEILRWLLAQHAGDTGIQWVLRLEDAIASLATLPERCPLAPENAGFPLKCGNCFTDGNRMCTASCSPSRVKLCMCSTSATAAASPFPRHKLRKYPGSHLRVVVK